MTKKRLATVLTILALITFLAYPWIQDGWQMWKESSPEFALLKVGEMRKFTDLNTKSEFLTDKGRDIMEVVIEQGGEIQSRSGFVQEASQISGQKCSVPFTVTNEGLAGHIQLVRSSEKVFSKWKFDDIIFTKYKGAAVSNLSLAYALHHPDAWPHKEVDWGLVADIVFGCADILLRIGGR